jgi:hypothetical protein
MLNKKRKRRGHKSPVEAIFYDGHVVRYASIAEAAEACNIAYPHTISDCCRGLAHTSGGLRWRYVE